MKADTQRYVGLQTIFRAKAKEDLALVDTILTELLSNLGLSRDLISKDELETFVKHSAYLKVVKGRSLRDEYENSKLIGQVGSFAFFPLFCFRLLIANSYFIIQ